MKLGTVFRFELGYQARRIAPWLYAGVLFLLAWSVVQFNYVPDARGGYLLLNSPLVVASTLVVGCLFWLFFGASVAGDAAARDIESGMHPLTFAAPVRKRDYLGGRFLAAYAINALVLLAAMAGMLLGMLWPDVEAGIVGPWRPMAFVLAYLVIALPNAFIATAVQFACAALGGRAALSYFGSLLLFFASMGLAVFVSVALRQQELARLLDPVGMIAVVSHLSDTWTPAEVKTQLVGLEPLLLANRALWLCVGAAILAWTHRRFRLMHPAERGRKARRRQAATLLPATGQATARLAVAPVDAGAPRNVGTFDRRTRWRQLAAVTGRSLRTLTRGWLVAGPLAVVAFMLYVVVSTHMEHLDVPLLPRTEHVLTYLTSAVANPASRPWMFLPLLLIFYAGELVWGERDARMGEIAGATPVPDWVFFAGRFLALAVVLVAWMLVIGMCGVMAQASLGYHQFELGLHAGVLFGLQLPEYLLFALLALAVHTIVDHKHLGALVALALYAFIAFAALFGVEHHLLVYGASPPWSYSDIQGFGGSLLPWLAFKAYWVGWALVLAVLARLALVRGREVRAGVRLRLARARLTRPTRVAGAVGLALVLGVGGAIFYNTNVLHTYYSSADLAARAAEYERRYGQHAEVPQPRVTATSMRVELHPEQGTAGISGEYRLVNPSDAAIDTVHVATALSQGLVTERLAFDRPATAVVVDEEHGHRSYRLAAPLQPGEAMQLAFELRFAPRGFFNWGIDESVLANGSWIQKGTWLPAIGYQKTRELHALADRAEAGLPARPEIPLLEDEAARQVLPGDVGIAFDAVIGTAGDQVAIAPGVLRRSWREGGRRYFHYTSDAPIREAVQVFSGRYAVHQEWWNDVAIQVFHHPAHAHVVEPIARAAQASLALYTKIYGPYPYGTLRFVENAGRGIGAHSEPGLIDYGDGFALLDPSRVPGSLDLVFAVTAHEVAHQWWGGQGLAPAPVEGIGFLAESMATYSATQVVEQALGHDQLVAYLGMMRNEYDVPRPLAAPPLLRATEQFQNYRQGPLALHALARYIGHDPLNLALRRLLAKHRHGSTPLATTLDLYRELQAVTPPRYRQLLHDLLAANTYWSLSAPRATTHPLPDGTWEVTVDVQARKFVVDMDGAEADQPLDEWVEVGVYPGPVQVRENGQVIVGEPLYLERHRLRDARQAITIRVPAEPGHVGVDPRTLLVDLQPRNNFMEIARP